jgi:hypothetical protein
MAGGLLNISATSSVNVILTGNPSKSFFKVVYSKYTNFGLQKFRLDFEGMRDLRLSTPSVFQFKIKRYADLLMDTYLCVTLPDIWSPVHPPCKETAYSWAPYDFRWIRDLGTQMIENITITSGSQVIQTYSGAYLSAMVQRDFTEEKKHIFNTMTGNTPEFNDLANAYGRINAYPCAYYMGNTQTVEPSFRSRNIYIPINNWFTMNSRCAFPLVALRYNELCINVTIRPIQELFQIRDVFDPENGFPYVKPDFSLPQFAMHQFLQPPPGVFVDPSNYPNTVSSWNADVHLLATYCFLSEEERQKFALEDQVYLIKDIFEYKFENIVGSKTVSLTSNGMIANWMWYLQRNDVNLRNEWGNYTNWPYSQLPNDIQPAPLYNTGGMLVPSASDASGNWGPGVNPPSIGQTIGLNTGFFITGESNLDNVRDIMTTMGISLNGAYRENVLPSEVFSYVEQYARSNGSGKRGLYCYNFCLDTSPYEYQPSGAMNLSKFKDINLEITTIIPSKSENNANFNIICDLAGNAIGVSKQNWRLYNYTYNMTLFEERYNVLSFVGGNCGMLYAR